MNKWDVIVLGVGGMGSAALHHLARRGVRVLGLEQFDIGHDRGSSHGDTRIIRKAYFECPDYVPLVLSSYELWHELEQARGQSFLTKTGLLSMGKPGCELMAGTQHSAEEHKLWIEPLTFDDVRSRFPGFMPGEGMHAVFEPDAGFLRVEACVRAHTDKAVAQGATLLTGQRVEAWTADQHGVEVRTTHEVYRGERLIICGGAWSARLLADLELPLEVWRKPVFWFAAAGDVYRLERGSPIFAIQNEEGFFYGFPQIDVAGVKVAEHFGKDVVQDADLVDRVVRPEVSSQVRGFITEHLPSLTHTITRTSVCLYTMTPDQHFIIDRHPQHSNVVFAAGFSGHGFKFTPVIGSVLADLAMTGQTREPVGFLSLKRLQAAR